MNTNSINEKSDLELINTCLQGSESAFNVIYDRYRLPLFSYLHKLLPGNNDLVNDLAQQTWIKAYRNFDRYDDRQKLLAWLCRIAHNLAMDHFRKESNMPTGELSPILASDLPGPEDGIRQDETNAALADAIAALPPEQREIIQLRAKGISFKDIAETKGINLNTALSRMHYAVTFLRKKLDDFI